MAMNMRLPITLLSFVMAATACAAKWYVLAEMSKREFAEYITLNPNDPNARSSNMGWLRRRILQEPTPDVSANWWFEGMRSMSRDPKASAGVWFKTRDTRRTITWSGGRNSRSEAQGEGTLQIYFGGNLAATYTGAMNSGWFSGIVQATYQNTNQKYVGEIDEWSEDGEGTMYYSDGRVVTGEWSNGKLVGSVQTKGQDIPKVVTDPVPRTTTPVPQASQAARAQSTPSSVTGTLMGVQLPRTKAEWISRLPPDAKATVSAGKVVCSTPALFRTVGKPDKTRFSGNYVYLYWSLTDGTIELVCDRMTFGVANLVIATMNDN